MNSKRNTESLSKYYQLEKIRVKDLSEGINAEDALVPLAVKEKIPKIKKLVLAIAEQINKGGHLFYPGVGTSGRLSILDASAPHFRGFLRSGYWTDCRQRCSYT